MSHPSHDPDDAYCFYCGKQYASQGRLFAHLRKKHPDTIAAYNLLPEHQPENYDVGT